MNEWWRCAGSVGSFVPYLSRPLVLAHKLQNIIHKVVKALHIRPQPMSALRAPHRLQVHSRDCKANHVELVDPAPKVASRLSRIHILCKVLFVRAPQECLSFSAERTKRKRRRENQTPSEPYICQVRRVPVNDQNRAFVVHRAKAALRLAILTLHNRGPCKCPQLEPLLVFHKAHAAQWSLLPSTPYKTHYSRCWPRPHPPPPPPYQCFGVYAPSVPAIFA